ncbi:MAG: hypothetical protein O2816_06830 [Planctomycetota bacterium]|nr:hypothetical protein [Planctomycetota bacterium]
MNGKLMKYGAYGIGAAVLLSGSFFLFAALSGTPMSEMKGVGGAFPEGSAEPAAATQGLPNHQDELDQDRRGRQQVLVESASPLRAFMLPAGWSADELEGLERELERQLELVDRRARDLDEREKNLAFDRKLYDELFAELEELRSGLIEQQGEQDAKGEELAADLTALASQRRSDFARLAPFYSEGKPAAQAPMLMNYAPRDAALILVALPTDRSASLVNEVFKLDPDKAKALQDAYMEATSVGPPAK